MITEIECKKTADIVIKTINKHSERWNKATIVTGYCHNEYNGCDLSYNDAKSIIISYWGEKYSDLPDNEMYSFEGYNYINEILKRHYISCQNDQNLRWNRGTITIYPSGEYESAFIWDEQAVQDVLISAIKMSFTTLYTNAIYKINEVFLPKKEWQTATLVVEFVEGKIQPLQITIPFEGETLNFSVGIENIERTKKDTNISDYERDYSLSNQENIRDKLYGSWTKVTMILHQNIFGGKFNLENYIFE